MFEPCTSFSGRRRHLMRDGRIICETGVEGYDQAGIDAVYRQFLVPARRWPKIDELPECRRCARKATKETGGVSGD